MDLGDELLMHVYTSIGPKLALTLCQCSGVSTVVSSSGTEQI